MMESTLGAMFLESAIAVFQKHKHWADQAIGQLSDENLRRPLDEHSNSVAVIMKHVAGNLLSRWTDCLTTDGEKPWRNRDQEFVDDLANRQEVLDCWERGWRCLFESLGSLVPEDLLKTITVRGEPHSVLLAIERSLAHCSYHVGQILMVARHWSGENWQTITIPRGQSASYNQTVWGTDNYRNTQPPAGDQP
jgi:hypothetical protein